MKYNSIFYDPFMTMFKLFLECPYLQKPSNGITKNLFQKIFDKTCRELYISQEDYEAVFRRLVDVDVIPHTIEMSPAELEAANGKIRGFTTAEARKAVEAAERRLEELVRRIPLDEAEAELAESERKLKEKRAAAEREKVEQERPKRELEDAERDFTEKENQVKRIRFDVGKKTQT